MKETPRLVFAAGFFDVRAFGSFGGIDLSPARLTDSAPLFASDRIRERPRRSEATMDTANFIEREEEAERERQVASTHRKRGAPRRFVLSFFRPPLPVLSFLHVFPRRPAAGPEADDLPGAPDRGQGGEGRGGERSRCGRCAAAPGEEERAPALPTLRRPRPSPRLPTFSAPSPPPPPRPPPARDPHLRQERQRLFRRGRFPGSAEERARNGAGAGKRRGRRRAGGSLPSLARRKAAAAAKLAAAARSRAKGAAVAAFGAGGVILALSGWGLVIALFLTGL